MRGYCGIQQELRGWKRDGAPTFQGKRGTLYYMPTRQAKSETDHGGYKKSNPGRTVRTVPDPKDQHRPAIDINSIGDIGDVLHPGEGFYRQLSKIEHQVATEKNQGQLYVGRVENANTKKGNCRRAGQEGPKSNFVPVKKKHPPTK
jgi:hypothetical protein